MGSTSMDNRMPDVWARECQPMSTHASSPNVTARRFFTYFLLRKAQRKDSGNLLSGKSTSGSRLCLRRNVLLQFRAQNPGLDHLSLGSVSSEKPHRELS